MCRQLGKQLNLSSNSPDQPEGPEETLYLPTSQIVACKRCFYPTMFEDDISWVIRNREDRMIEIVMPISYLFPDVQLMNVNLVEQWRTRTYCPNCGIILGYLDEFINPETDVNGDFANIFSFRSAEQVVILFHKFLYLGTSEDVHNRVHNANP